MRTIRLFGMALLTVLMSVSYSACSSSSDDDNEVVPEVNPLVGTWTGEYHQSHSNYLCNATFDSNFNYSFHIYGKEIEKEIGGFPKNNTYKIREGNRLILYVEKDSVVFTYLIDSNTLLLNRYKV